MAEAQKTFEAQDVLADYIHAERLIPFRQQRKDLEEKWERNRQAFAGDAEGLFKRAGMEDWQANYFIRKTHQKAMAGYAIVVQIMIRNGRVTFDIDQPLNDPRLNMMHLQMDESQLGDYRRDMRDLMDAQMRLVNSDRHLMKAILSAALYGRTVLKGTIEEVELDGGWDFQQLPEGMDGSMLPADALAMRQLTQMVQQPGVAYVPVWDIFRDLTAPDIKSAIGVIHRQHLTPFDVRQLINSPLYMPEAVKAALRQPIQDEQDDTSSIAPLLRNIGTINKREPVYESWGQVPRSVLDEFQKRLKSEDAAMLRLDELSDDEESGNMVECMATMFRGRVIRFAQIKPQDRPFFEADWELTLDEQLPCGIADNVEDEQRIYNEFVNLAVDNKRLSANVQGVGKSRYFRDGKMSLGKPGTLVEVTEDCDDTRKAFQQVVITDVADAVFSLLNLIDALIDEDSGIPKIAQGVKVNKQATATEVAEQVEAAGKYIGSIIRNLDEGLIEPMAEWFYGYNMADPECPIQKVPGRVKATGFSTYEVKQNKLDSLNKYIQILASFPQLQEHAAVRAINSKLVEFLDLDPKTTEVTDEELQQRSQAAQQKEQMEQDRAQAETEKLRAEAEESLAQAEKDRSDAQVNISEVAIKKAEAVKRMSEPDKKPEEREEHPDV